ncbi:hypothetical protein TNCV_5016381 [Trichonephila clavipes]|nr:hypothetical protein TNCV_5016381 [Trichonephila clavipes]
MISGHGLKSKLRVAKVQKNVSQYYWKPVVKIHYQIGRLHDGLKRFIRVEIRLRICKAQVGSPEKSVNQLNVITDIHHVLRMTRI